MSLICLKIVEIDHAVDDRFARVGRAQANVAGGFDQYWARDMRHRVNGSVVAQQPSLLFSARLRQRFPGQVAVPPPAEENHQRDVEQASIDEQYTVYRRHCEQRAKGPWAARIPPVATSRMIAARQMPKRDDIAFGRFQAIIRSVSVRRF